MRETRGGGRGITQGITHYVTHRGVRNLGSCALSCARTCAKWSVQFWPLAPAVARQFGREQYREWVESQDDIRSVEL